MSAQWAAALAPWALLGFMFGEHFWRRWRSRRYLKAASKSAEEASEAWRKFAEELFEPTDKAPKG